MIKKNLKIGIMQQSNEANSLLNEWEQYKDHPTPVPCTLNEALEFTKTKEKLNALSYQIRNCRLENNANGEKIHIDQFCQIYDAFYKDYVYKILKNAKRST